MERRRTLLEIRVATATIGACFVVLSCGGDDEEMAAESESEAESESDNDCSIPVGIECGSSDFVCDADEVCVAIFNCDDGDSASTGYTCRPVAPSCVDGCASCDCMVDSLIGGCDDACFNESDLICCDQ